MATALADLFRTGGQAATLYYSDGSPVLSTTPDPDPDPGADNSTPLAGALGVAIFVNQSGYDLGRPKAATVTNTTDGTTATVKSATTGTVVHTATVAGGRVDLSTFDTPGIYRIDCNGARSHNFRIGKYWNARVSTIPALAFMNQSRQDTFEVGNSTGYGWRDSHQFSFELHTLVAQFCANPALYERLPHGIVETATCEYPELQVQTQPDIVWLIEFGVRRYLDLAAGGVKLHQLIKEQLAYFLWVYPHISEWVPQSLYDDALALTLAEWPEPTCTLSWYDTSSAHNLYQTQNMIGGAKGAEPPGHRIMPNLLMHEVALRDGLPGAQAFLDAAVANATWLIGLLRTHAPHFKGQRMSEHITLTGLCYMIEKYPAQTPAGALTWVGDVVARFLARSANMWDFRMFTKVSAGDAADRWTNLQNYNEPGNIAGLPAGMLAARRVLTDPTTRDELERVAQAQFDTVFGRNPYRRHYCHTAPAEFQGVEVGWATRHQGGYGALEDVDGQLDGSPKENAYPFDPLAADSHSEGWVAFNSAWNHALAYHAADDTALSVLHPTTGAPVTTAAAGSQVRLRLRAPLNFNEAAVETGYVLVSVDGAAPTKVTVTEESADGWHFDALWTVPGGSSSFVVSYGYGLFRQAAVVTVD